MGTKEALLAGIVENPDDDAPRLVFADWCEENGEADRAEFIRAQIRLEGIPEWESERFDLEERSLDLLAGHWEEWTATLPDWARRQPLAFRRGLVGEITSPPDRLLDGGEDLVSAAPLLRLTLNGLGDRAEELARSPALRNLREIEVRPFRDLPGLIPFFRTWQPQHLRHLGLVTHVVDRGDEAAVELLRLRQWRTLRRLDLQAPFGEESATTAARLHGLAALHFEAFLRSRTVQAIASAGWQRLERLSMRGFWTSELRHREDERTMRADDLRAIRKAPWFPRLRSLEIAGTAFNACAVLSKAPAGLRHLAISDSPQGDGGHAWLLRSDLVAGLSSLELRGLSSARTMTELATSPRMSGLSRLAALPLDPGPGYMSLSPDLLCDVVESPHLARVTRLELDAGNLDPEAAERFASLGGLSRLLELTLRGSRLGEAGMRALARSPHLDNLRRLTLDDAGDGSRLRPLLEARWLPSLRELRLRCAGIDGEALKALAACDALSHLRVLEVSKELLGRDGPEALAKSPHLGRLIRLAFYEDKPQSETAFAPLVERFGGRFAIEYE
jgi:uncharacterized protein (TIGR02996 family)